MTCVVAWAEKNKVWMGGDSAASSGGWGIVTIATSKVFVKNHFIIGISGYPRIIQLLKYSLSLPTPKSKDDIMEFLVNEFIEKIRKLFKDKGFATKEDNKERVEGVILLGYKDKIYQIQSNYQIVQRKENFDAIGCGEDFALGALFTIRNLELTPKEKIKCALTTAEHYSGGVVKPFTIKHN